MIRMTYKSFDAVNPSVPRKKHQNENRTFQGIPGIVRSPHGRLFATWYGGGTTECCENYAILAISDDDGLSWQEPVAVIDPPTHQVRAFDPVLWISPTGEFFWFWNQSCGDEDGSWDGYDGVAGVFFSILENPEAAPSEFKFSPARRICHGVMMNKPTVLSDGTWALPVTVWTGERFMKHPSLDLKQGWSFLVSEDRGKSFSSRATVSMADIEGGPCFEEHSFVERNDGSIICYMRVNAGIAESVSHDGGFTWSNPVLSETMNGPNSRAYAFRLRSGRLLMLNHDCPRYQEGEPDWRPRDRLAAFLSEDDGRTWPYKLLLDERPGVTYPDGIEEADGSISVIYDFSRQHGGHILWARITEDDIFAGTLVSDASFLRREISHTRPVKETGSSVTALPQAEICR